MDIHAVFSMVKDLFKKLFLHSPKRTFFVVGGLIVMIALPITLLLASQSQDLRQRASENPQGIPGNVLTLLKGYAYPAYLPGGPGQGYGCSDSGCTELYTCKDGEMASTFGYGRDEAGSGSVSWYTLTCPQGSVCRNVNIGGDAGIQCVKQNPTVTCNDIYEDGNYSCTTQDKCGSPNSWYDGNGTTCKNFATNYGCCKSGFNCYDINCGSGQTCIEKYAGAGQGYCAPSWSLDVGAACGGPQGPSGSACKLGSSCSTGNICVANSSITQTPGTTTTPPTPSPTPALPSVGTVAVDTCVGGNPSSARFRWTRTQTGLNYEVRWGSDTSYSEKQTYGEVSESSVISGFTPGTIYYSIRPYLGSVAGPSSTGTKTIPSTCGDVTLPTDTPNPGSSGGTGTNVCPGTCQANNKLGTACTGGSWSPMGGSCTTSGTSCQTCILGSSGTKQPGEPCTVTSTDPQTGQQVDNCTVGYRCTNYFGSLTCISKCGVNGCTEPRVCTNVTAGMNLGIVGWMCYAPPTPIPPTPTPTRTPTPRPPSPTQTVNSNPSPTPSPTPTTRAGLSCDPNQDGRIDTLDFQIWRDEYNSKNGVRSACFAPSTSTVDLLDFQAWKDINFGRRPVL